MGTVRMSDLLEQARSFDPSKVESRTTTWAPLEEGFASDAQRRAAFASGYKEKGKKKKDEEVEVVNELTAAEKKLINMMYDKKGNLTPLGKKVMDHGKKKEQVEVQESGHTDVASAMTNVKVAMSALTKMSGELSKLSPEDALPSWWTNKVAIAVDKLDGMADYLDTQVEEVELDEGTWHIAKNMNALKKRMQKPIPKGDLMVKFVMKHIGDDELADDMFDAKTGTDMVPMIKSAMKRLNIKEEVELDEAKFSPKEIKMAIGIASDKRYAGGNMTGAVKAIENIHKGLSDHPQVRAVLKRQNEAYDSDTEHTKDPKSHVKLNKETGKYCVYDMKDKKVAEFDTKDEAEAYAVKNHDALMNEELEEAVAYKFAAVDPKNLVIGMASKESDAKDMAHRYKGAAHIIKLKKPLSPKKGDMMINRPLIDVQRAALKEETELDEGKMKDLAMKIDRVASNMRKDRMMKPFVDKFKKDAMKTLDVRKSLEKVIPKTSTVTYGQINYALTKEDFDEGKIKDIVTDVEDAMGKIKYKLSQKGGKFIIRVSKNDEKDAQKAMKMNPLYIAGKLRVIPESFLIASTVDRITRSEARDIDPADIDVRATDKDVENASKNIILQLRKVINLRGAKPVEFASGKEKVHPNVAAAALTKHENMRRADDKEAFQRKIARSYKDLLNAVKGK